MTEVENDGLEEMMDHNFKEIPKWKEQITIRGIVASVLIGIIYSIIVMKLNLTTGLVPNLNVPAALLAFLLIRTCVLNNVNIMNVAGKHNILLK
ncbi:Metal-nicotianamine transporter ysl3 [Castilleja foliolosa]|uniref:Metal-nicotianamine transporter ysl3 n=1 Tax=Castilleja foliolosa TaxID=1961234 RepID=A0ABD3EA06_9LAMI